MQFFVIRECQNSKTDIEKLFSKDDTNDCQIKFVCLYDYSYAVLNFKLDEHNQLDCSLEHIKHYALTNLLKPQGEEEDNEPASKDLPRRYQTMRDNKIAAALTKKLGL